MTENNWYKYYNLLIFDEIDSTNEEAKRLCRAGIRENFIIWAKSQTKGKGRYSRHWISPEGNLYFSILIRPDLNIKKATELSFLVAVVVGDIIKEDYGFNFVEYKWPNDLMINGKKFGGVLLESSAKKDSNMVDWLIIGIGINIEQYPSALVNYPTTSLKDEKINANCEDLFAKIMKIFSKYYYIWQDIGFRHVKEKWLEKAMNLGKVITINIGNNRISGVFSAIGINGDIELTLASGEICSISSGEIIL